MENEIHENNVFKSENCRAQKAAADLVDCLSSEQSHLCGFSMQFGYGYFCMHPRRNEIIEISKKLQNNLSSLSDVLQLDDLE